MSSSDLSVSVLDLPVEPGSRRDIHIDWTVPDGWSTEVLRLPEDSVVPLEVVLTTIDDGIYVEISGVANLAGECIRCLKPLTIAQPIAAAETYVYPERGSRKRTRKYESQAGSVEVEGDDFDVPLEINRNHIDIESLLRDAVFADAPFQPLCSKGCKGICEHCGVLLEEAEPNHHHEFLDPRFAALKDFFVDEDPSDGVSSERVSKTDANAVDAETDS